MLVLLASILCLLPVEALRTDRSHEFKSQIDELKTHPELDVVFLVDGSSSVGKDNFASELGFVKKLLSDFAVSENNTKVSVVVFSSHAHIYEEANKCELLNYVLPNIVYLGGGTNTLGAFLAAREILLFSRKNSTKVIFLVTDGFSNGGNPVPIAEELKTIFSIKIFTIGIKTGNKKELGLLTTSRNTSYLLEGFGEFDFLARKALHVDLREGDYIPVEKNRCVPKCDNLAYCTCGTTTGHYICRCKKGFYGSGMIGDCQQCPKGTYHNSKDNTCTPCPDTNHVTIPNKPALSLDACKCKTGWRKVKNEAKCEVVRCPVLKPPKNGYFVGGPTCPNILNNACGVRCNIGYTLRGNSIRLCKEDGEWTGIEPHCHLKTCSKPPIPTAGAVKCANTDLELYYEDLPQEMPVDTECEFKCTLGHSLVGSKKRICLPVAQWDGLRTTCKPLRCARLYKIPHGQAHPESCTKEKQKYGSKCKIICNDDGFEGPAEIECLGKGRHGMWSAKPKCVDVEPPKLQCPGNIKNSTILGKPYGVATWMEPSVSDNSNNSVNVWWEPSSEENNLYKFEIGSTVITYHAVDLYGNGATCNFTIEIVDVEAPIFINCDSPAPYLVGKPDMHIEWDEPEVTDNSLGDIKIEKSHQFGPLEEGTTEVVYTAYDEFNNKNTCSINITVQMSSCEVQKPESQDCNEVPGGVFCVLTCEEGYAFPVTDKATCDVDNPMWLIPDCTPTEIPEEVTGEIGKADACEELNYKCVEGNCEVLECESNNRITRSTSENGIKKTRFRIKLEGVQEVEDRLKGLPVVSLQARCRNGSVPLQGKKKCVRCPKGTFHNTNVNKCEPCSPDTYSDKSGSIVCESCSDGRTTRGRKGSKTSKACRSKPGSRRFYVRKEPCRKDTCKHGVCVSVGTTRHRCKCDSEWMGARCRMRRINPCDTDPCLNGATCTINESNNNYTCTCLEGFLGKSCELEDLEEADEAAPPVDVCSQIENLCENGGTCQVDEEKNTFRCVCPEGFIGKRCQILPCDYRPCPNTTVCINKPENITTKTSYKCDCPTGRAEPPECKKMNCPCQNNGVCTDDNYTSCKCPKLYTGEFCNTKLSSDYVLDFPVSGITDYAIIDAPKDNLTELTLCAWVKTNNTFNYGTILSYANIDIDNALTLIDYAGLVIWLNGKFLVTDAKINDGIWHQICLSWSMSEGEYNVYIDSILRTNGTGLSKNKPIKGNGILILGQDQDTLGGGFSRSESFVGRITYVDIWKKRLSLYEMSHKCHQDFTGGDFVSWVEFQQGIKGDVKVEPSHFCTGCKLPTNYNITNGQLEIVNNGSQLMLQCHKGYVVKLGNSYKTKSSNQLRRNCSDSGSWEKEEITWDCVKVHCSHPGRIKNGKIKPRIRRFYLYGDVINYECFEEYELTGNDTRTCGENGTWTGDSPECLGAICDAPLEIPKQANVTIVSEHYYEEDFKNLTRFEAGTVLEVSCRNETSYLTCQENRTWDGELPKCYQESLYCDAGEAPSVPENGYSSDLDSEDSTFIKYPTGGVISYKCRSGYEIYGVNYTVCLDDGTWAKTNTTCKPIRCPPPPRYHSMILKKQPLAEYSFGNMLVYECKPGYSFYGNSVIRCLDNGRWSRIKGKCARISCGKPKPVSEDETIIGNSYLYKDTLTIMCPEGASNVFYTAQCTHSGKWLYLGDCNTETA